MKRTIALVLLLTSLVFSYGEQLSVTISPELYIGAAIAEYSSTNGIASVIGGGVQLGRRHFVGLDAILASSYSNQDTTARRNMGLRAAYYYAPFMVDYRFKTEIGFAVACGYNKHDRSYGSWGIPVRISIGNGSVFWYSSFYANVTMLSDFVNGKYIDAPSEMSIGTGIKVRFTAPDTMSYHRRELRKEEQAEFRKNRSYRDRPLALYISLGITQGVSFTKSSVSIDNGIDPYVGGELEVGVTRNQKHLWYGTFSGSSGVGVNCFGSMVGYNYIFSKGLKHTFRVGAALGFHEMNKHKSVSGAQTVYADQSAPFVIGPVARLELGKGAVRFLVKDNLLIGKGLYNTFALGMAFDFSKRTIR